MPHSSRTSDAPPVRRETPQLEFRRLSGRVQKGVFSCGEREIDKWLLDAHKDHARLKARVTTAHLAGNSHPAAFYGMRIRVENDSDIAGHKGFRVEDGVFAAVQLCYVGTHLPLQGCGVGGVMMAHALREFAEVAMRTGICALTLIAIDEKKADWYQGLGFERYGKPSKQPKMFFPAQSAIDLISA